MPARWVVGVGMSQWVGKRLLWQVQRLMKKVSDGVNANPLPRTDALLHPGWGTMAVLPHSDVKKTCQR